MQRNQTDFEVVRDIATLLQNMKSGQTIAIAVTRHDSRVFFDWCSSEGTPCGLSETAYNMRMAYKNPITR